MLSHSYAAFCRNTVWIFLSMFVAMPITIFAGEYNEVLSVGDAAPAWSDLPGTDDQSHAFSELSDKSIVVVVFTCRSCPTARDYEQRIDQLAAKYEAKDSPVSLVAVCVNRVPQDTLVELKKHANEAKLHFTFLYDESQKIAKEYGAMFTPQFFVLNKERRIVYMGAMDEEPEPGNVTKHYVEDAISATLAGKEPAVKETIARGCRIRYVNDRKRK